MDEFRHEKTACRYGKKCYAFMRLTENGYRQDDIGHCSVYFHDTRRGGMTTNDNFGFKKFVSAFQTWDPDTPREIEFWHGNINKGDLVKELESNGFGYVMNPTNGPYKHLDEVVQEKLNHPRHIRIGSPLSDEQMLAIILYCGTDAYADMRSDEIQYTMQTFHWGEAAKKQKWPVFSNILDDAIRCLNEADKDRRPSRVYHGLKDIEVDPKTFNNESRAALYQQHNKQHFKYGTFVSTSWDKEVSLSFMGNHGSLLTIDLTNESNDKICGADVSWISKFPIESEFLIARSATFDIQQMYFSQDHTYQIVDVVAGRYCHYIQNCIQY
ncbi:unnamed protein product [Rotaria magnacalcarata]|uniref:ADP ribosyltransferase domain-containing protein n=1 Tax=Rotaria magnacalcarata TaxID=392030 RepID=A0A815BNY0_9BILA|nr:unnamed protein product [Rotaria magnacalcarata]CAF1679009.1 unnamed protein product [Rotaria magnacalcarata]CAF1996236.1 unnamed protein product [Rotaria magnacalcarata]CAF2028699.1 unnamed protein product [Rotaria magnacalcarata]CAF2126427.1 unnamed protein product [Rotaria magnacalcarata]